VRPFAVLNRHDNLQDCTQTSSCIMILATATSCTAADPMGQYMDLDSLSQTDPDAPRDLLDSLSAEDAWGPKVQRSRSS